MRILFVHQNFPGQFKFLVSELVARGHEVVATTMRQRSSDQWSGVRLVRYGPKRGSSQGIHPWVSDLETKVIRAEAFFHVAMKLKTEGFLPDVIIAHPGWGETLFVKEVWPDAKLGVYCEFFYHACGVDVGFDPEFSVEDPGTACRMRIKNVNNLLHFDIADAGISPTQWQASTFPESFRSKISVIHDGIDTDRLVPNVAVRLALNRDTILSHGDEVITFVNRNLEPYRGYHILMRALPDLLARRPNARVLIVGGSDVSYGTRPKQGSWKENFIQEVRPRISDADWSRVHFLGTLGYDQFVALLQVSAVHIYLTYPFVLSWSLLEAMSVGCTIVASDTQPLHEVIEHDVTGRLIDFFDVSALTNQVCELLDDPAARRRLGDAARQFVVEHYDLKTVCLPRQVKWVEQLVGLEKN